MIYLLIAVALFSMAASAVQLIAAIWSRRHCCRYRHWAGTCPGRPCGSECDHVEFCTPWRWLYLWWANE